ncbi:unnamed protein product [[Candida] boidinii]|uniref:Unnamed protein product n=1 Tax=Candida boidinii TaxID=5477 RepID=A0A9W6WHW3_CANBO|nr:unnamed protein product [[Candida] boidinii]GMF73131.1 unnamed protein product [[Candida] boidinii]
MNNTPSKSNLGNLDTLSESAIYKSRRESFSPEYINNSNNPNIKKNNTLNINNTNSNNKILNPNSVSNKLSSSFNIKFNQKSSKLNVILNNGNHSIGKDGLLTPRTNENDENENAIDDEDDEILKDAKFVPRIEESSSNADANNAKNVDAMDEDDDIAIDDTTDGGVFGDMEN